MECSERRKPLAFWDAGSKRIVLIMLVGLSKGWTTSTADCNAFERFCDTAPTSIAILFSKVCPFFVGSSVFTTHLSHDASAEVFGSGIVGTPLMKACV